MMKSKILLAASVALLACSCQSKDSDMQQNKKQECPAKKPASGGCCELEKAKQGPCAEVKAPSAEAKTAEAPSLSGEVKSNEAKVSVNPPATETLQPHATQETVAVPPANKAP